MVNALALFKMDAWVTDEMTSQIWFDELLQREAGGVRLDAR